ncbi:MAG: LytTR family DNA-binding domain-containing protein [Bacteroidota bacterium]
MKAIIIEDEILGIKSLSSLLERYCPQVEICGTAMDVEHGSNLIREVQPELVFLDVQLSGGTGFEILKQLEELNFQVIFITAFSQYAIKAIKFNALDYLLKPIDVDELKIAVEKAEKQLAKKGENPQLKQLVQNQQESSDDPLITLPTAESLEFIRISEIVRCKAEGAYTLFFIQDGRQILVSKHIKVYERLLNEHSFYRPHQSHLINRQYLQRFIKGDGGYLLMNDGSSIPVSKHRRSDFLKWIAGDQLDKIRIIKDQ